MKVLCRLGMHKTKRDKQWIIDGVPMIGAYCQRCGTFIPKENKNGILHDR
jgi:hypothetical protein